MRLGLETWFEFWIVWFGRVNVTINIVCLQDEQQLESTGIL